MPARDDEPRMLDLSNFANPDEALRRARVGLAAYTDIAREGLAQSNTMQVAHMAFMAFVARARGLHEAIVREIMRENPHAVFVLLRGMAELATLLLYTNEHPGYVDTVVGLAPDRFRRKSFEAMFAAVRARAPGLKLVYANLSDYAHLGPAGIANAMTPVDDDAQAVAWTDKPHWRSANDYRAACALTEEVVEMVLECLREFGGVHFTAGTPGIGTIDEHRPVTAADLDRLRTHEEDESAS